MRYIRAALARIAGVFGKDTADDDLREEMQAHLDMEIAENVRRGMSPTEARRQALLVSAGSPSPPMPCGTSADCPGSTASRLISGTPCGRSARARRSPPWSSSRWR
jgi:hypothetical protein